MHIVAADWAAWASVTFTGARHRLTFELPASPAGEAWLAALPELDLPLTGHLVADLQVAAVHRTEGLLCAQVEALTVEEC